jgi:hypothetical protein
MVQIGGEFRASTAISQDGETIATGLPRAIANSLGQFTAMNGTQSKPIHLDIKSDGDLTTFYAGSIAANDIVRFGFCYISQD